MTDLIGSPYTPRVCINPFVPTSSYSPSHIDSAHKTISSLFSTYIFCTYLHVFSFDFDFDFDFDTLFRTLPGEILKNHQPTDPRLLRLVKQRRLAFPTKVKILLVVAVHLSLLTKINLSHSLPPALV